MAESNPAFNRKIYKALDELKHKDGSDYRAIKHYILAKYEKDLREGWVKNLRDELANMVKKQSIIKEVRWNSLAKRGRSSRGFPLPRPIGPCYCCQHPKDLTFGRLRCD